MFFYFMASAIIKLQKTYFKGLKGSHPTEGPSEEILCCTILQQPQMGYKRVYRGRAKLYRISVKGRGLRAPCHSYPLLPPSAAGSSPSPPAHPVASFQHPQHHVSRNSTLETNTADPPVPGKHKNGTIKRRECQTRKLETGQPYQLCSRNTDLLSH